MKKQTFPHPNNFCGGNFKNWLEVYLTDACNGTCSWCIDKDGYRPKHRASWQQLHQAILSTGKKHIMFLGGEPTLYPHLKELIQACDNYGLKTYLTTNGSLLKNDFAIKHNLHLLTGLNISIHSFIEKYNNKITGVALDFVKLKKEISSLRIEDVSIRLNCNLIKGHVDCVYQIYTYIEFAKQMHADKVRFAELKIDETSFINLVDLFKNKYDLTNDPYENGCSKDAIINGMPVNFRLMCGMQTSKREAPVNPIILPKQVLYYDGIIYPGWIKNKESEKMPTEKEEIKAIKKQIKEKNKEIKELEDQVEEIQDKMENWDIAKIKEKMKSNEITIDEGTKLIELHIIRNNSNSGGSCMY